MRTTSHEEDVARRGLRTDLPGPSVVRVDDDSAPGAPNLNRARAVCLPVSSGLDHSQSGSDSTNLPASGRLLADALRASARSKLHVDPEGAWRGGDQSPQER